MIDWTEAFGFVTGVACVWLLARQSLWNWPIALANNAVYLAVFLRAGLYGDAGLQVVYAALGVYGWWAWLHGGAARKQLQVARMPARVAAGLAMATALATVALGLFLDRATDSTVPWADALTTALSLAATWGQARKLLESWWIWIAADVIYVPLYLYKDLRLTAVLYVVFMALCVMGLREWRKALSEQPTE